MTGFYFSSGDLDFFWNSQMKSFPWVPQIFHLERGFGNSLLHILWISYPMQLLLKVASVFGISWFYVEKILWISVFVLAIYSSYRLVSHITKTKWFALLGSLIYSMNTYILLLFGGGQLGVALAYSVSPLVLLKFITFIDTQMNHPDKIKNALENGLLLALLICFDLRVAYLVLLAIGLYALLHMKWNRFKPVYVFIIPLLIAFLVHLFWILPLILVRGGFEAGQDFTNPGMLKFLSVADFSHALSLLHPNWPENLFGKVYFLQPEFLVLPILAFSALLFVHKTNKTDKTYTTKIIFFATLAFIGTFLSKGTHDPFGGIFVWLFEHVPGFVMFRDPTKFYLFTALSYSVLIPFTLHEISERESIWHLVSGIWHKKKQMHFILNTRYAIFYTLFIGFWLFTIRAVFTGQVAGNFRPLTLPHEYIELKNVLVNDTESYRTLWLPRTDKFFYSSDIHPVLTGDTLWKNASMGVLLSIIESSDFSKTLGKAGVRYVIVPMDVEKRIFLSDYQWDPTMRDRLIDVLSQTSLSRHKEFTDIAVFENPTYTFRIDIPPYIGKQEYWSRVGAIISLLSLVMCISVILIRKRKYGK